ncbi:MAG: LicD family protein [Ruminococcus sp.]|nr:LicD family protein [Ruminococcus sp.]
MLSQEVLSDYREDWIERCVSSDNTDKAVLRDRGVFLLADESSIFFSVAESILTALYVPMNEASISGREVMLAFDMISSPLSADKRKELEDHCGNKLLVTDSRENARMSLPIMPVLYVPRVFGAGLEIEETAHKNESTHITELFSAALFLISRRDTLKHAAYYVGFGGCTIKGAKDVTSGSYERLMPYDDAVRMLEFSKQRPNDLFYFADTYDGQLQGLHKRLFECLDEFDRICRENDIRYFLGGGSLLGAARYNDIIPWDDDMDVMMTRDDYEKFLSAVNKSIDRDKFFFQSSETDPKYHSIFTKIRLNGTKYVTEFSKDHYHLHEGIFIDIFVHDKTSDIKLLRKLHVFLTLFARSMVFNKWADKPMHFYGKFPRICSLVTKLIRRTDMKTLERIQHRVVTMFDGRDTHYLYDGTGEHLRHGGFPASWLADVKYLKFGSKKYPVPAEFDKYLRYSYGDYKKPIPASLRKAGHDVVEFDLGID